MSSLPPTLVIKNANELVTLQGSPKPRIKEQMANLNLIRDGCVIVHKNKIIDIGKTSKMLRSHSVSKETEIIDARGKTVLPGFVDPHTHLIFAGSREDEFILKIQGHSYMEILRRGGGINVSVEATRKASKTKLIKLGKKRLDHMAKFGTTTVEAKSGYGLTTKDEIKILQSNKVLNQQHPLTVISTFLGAHVVPREYRDHEEVYVDIIINEMIPKISKDNLAEFCDVFCENGVFSIDQSKRILEAGKLHGLKPKIHADEMTPFGGAELAAEVEAISADHLLNVSKTGITELCKRGVIGVLLPATPFSSLMPEYAPARQLIDSGVAVALGTDFNPNCMTESMQFIIALACLKMKMTPAEAITASTINAAHAININSRVGSLEPGKEADIVIFNIPNHKHLPYHFGVNLAETVIKSGKRIYNGS